MEARTANREPVKERSNFDASNVVMVWMEALLAMDGLSTEIPAFVASNVAAERMEAPDCAVEFGLVQHGRGTRRSRR